MKGTGGEEDRGGDRQPLQPSKVNTRKKKKAAWNLERRRWMAGVFLKARSGEDCFLTCEPKKPTEDMKDVQGGSSSR